MIAVLFIVYGMPSSFDELESYYTKIYHGKPSPEAMEAAYERFRNIAVCDPFYAVTVRQARALERRLQTKGNIRTYVGSLHTAPFIDEAVETIVRDGAEKLIVLPMTLLYSKSGVGRYIKLATDALKKHRSEIPVLGMTHWCHDPAIAALLADRLRMAVHWLPEKMHLDTKVIFTTHSKPGIASAHTDYIEEFEALANQVSARASVTDWTSAYRSAGPPPQRWIGPDLLDVIAQAANQGKKAIVACDLLSAAENVEVLHDIGTEARTVAREHGLEFVRTEFLNDTDDFMQELARIVWDELVQHKFVQT